MAQAAEGIPRAVWAVTALHLVLLLGYSVVVPAFRAPDEHLHVDRARASLSRGLRNRTSARDRCRLRSWRRGSRHRCT